MNEDFRDLLRALLRSGAEFLVVGAHALAAHGVARTTVDLDVLVRPSEENARRVYSALAGFGAPLAAHGVREDDFAHPGTVYQLGLPPRRIDVTTSIDGVSFDEAWRGRMRRRVEGQEVSFLGLEQLVVNKRATGRAKDKLDLELLREAGFEVEDGS